MALGSGFLALALGSNNYIVKNAFIPKKYSPLLFDIQQMNIVHSYDEHEFLFQTLNFMAPVSV